MRYVIYRADRGVYLGNCMGMGFWSKWDAVGQDAAVAFPSEAAARAHVATWDEPLSSFEVRSVPTFSRFEGSGMPVNADYASIEECVAAGLPAWHPDDHDSGEG